MLCVLVLLMLLAGCLHARLHPIAYASKIDFSVSEMLASASANNVSMIMMGAGDAVSWGQGLIKKFFRVREYVVTHVADDDVVLVIDATDVLFLGGEAEFLNKYRRHVESGGAPIVFNAQPEETDSNGEYSNPITLRLRALGMIKQKQNRIPQNIYWGLNAGAFIGRGAEVKLLLQNASSIKDFEHDQAWLQAVAVSHPHLVSIDYAAALFVVVQDFRNTAGLALWPGRDCAVHGCASLADLVKFEFGRIVFVPSSERPVLAHFAGPGHWQKNGSCLFLDVMKHRYAAELAQLGYGLLNDYEIGCGMASLIKRLVQFRRSNCRNIVILSVFFMAVSAIAFFCRGRHWLVIKTCGERNTCLCIPSPRVRKVQAHEV